MNELERQVLVRYLDDRQNTQIFPFGKSYFDISFNHNVSAKKLAGYINKNYY